MRRLPPLLPLLLLLAVHGAADARMYQWTSPATGSVQLSGTPPPWYRSEKGGPRVRVFDDGRLVDDTAIALPPAHAEALRESAFHELSERRRLETLRNLEQVAKRQAARAAESADAEAAPADAGEAGEAAAAAATGEDAAGPAQTLPQELPEEAIERLKALVRSFEIGQGAAATAAQGN